MQTREQRFASFPAEPSPQAAPDGAPPLPTDRELVLSARAGSRPALEALVRRYQRPLYYLCYGYVHDPDTAADLTQRAFMSVLHNLPSLRETELFKSWLFKIGVNLARNHLRDHARFVDDSHADPVVAPEALDSIESTEISEALRHAVSRLPPRQRIVLQLRVYEEMSFEEIARALRTTANAAKVNFHYAVKRLKDVFRRSSSEGRPGHASADESLLKAPSRQHRPPRIGWPAARPQCSN